MSIKAFSLNNNGLLKTLVLAQLSLSFVLRHLCNSSDGVTKYNSTQGSQKQRGQKDLQLTFHVPKYTCQKHSVNHSIRNNNH